MLTWHWAPAEHLPMLTWHDAPRVARVTFAAPPLLQAQLYFRRLLLAPVGAPVLSFHRAPAEHLAMLTWHAP